MMIKQYKNFLPQDLFTEVAQYAKTAYFSNSHIFKSNACWSPHIVLDSFPVLIHNLNKDSEIYNKIHSTVCSKVDIKIKEILFYYWTRYSYIPWHNDEHKPKAVTLYINETWDPNWGGYFMYDDGNGVKAIYPEPNSAVCNDSHTLHCTTPVTYTGSVRATIQIFGEE